MAQIHRSLTDWYHQDHWSRTGASVPAIIPRRGNSASRHLLRAAWPARALIWLMAQVFEGIANQRRRQAAEIVAQHGQDRFSDSLEREIARVHLEQGASTRPRPQRGLE